MKKIAICGYTSSVGRYFLQRYKDRFDFVLLGRKEPDIYLDLKKGEFFGNTESLRNCDVLLNLAAQTEDHTFDNIIGMIQTNIMGPMYLAEIAKNYGIGKFIHMSSISAVYSPKDTFYGYYSQTKKSADELLSLFCMKNDIPCCILRPTALFGTEEFGKHQKLLYNIMRRVEKKQPVYLYGTRDAYRNYIHVCTLCEVMCKLTEKDVTGIFSVANSRNSRLTEIVTALNKYYNGSSEVIYLPDKPNIPDLNISDSGEIYRLLDIKAPDGFEEQLYRER